MIVFNRLEQLSASNWTRVALVATIPGLTVAMLLIAWIAADASAAQRSHQRRCAGNSSFRCAHFQPPAASGLSRGPVRRSKRFRNDESAIGQLPGHLRSTRALVLDSPCDGGPRRPCRARRELPDILLLPPSPQSTQALDAYGIPAIEDVPPIAIGRKENRRDRDALRLIIRPEGQ